MLEQRSFLVIFGSKHILSAFCDRLIFNVRLRPAFTLRTLAYKDVTFGYM